MKRKCVQILWHTSLIPALGNQGDRKILNSKPVCATDLDLLKREGRYDTLLTERSLVTVAHTFIAVLGKQRQVSTGRWISMSLDLALKEQITHDFIYMRHFNLANSEKQGKE